jgi:hypothetical protein
MDSGGPHCVKPDRTASSSGDQNTEHEVYAAGAVRDYLESGGWIRDQEALRIRRVVNH